MIFQLIHICHCLETIKVYFCTISFKVIKNILNVGMNTDTPQDMLHVYR